MLTPGTILRDSYMVVRLIAQGGMGAVYLAKHQRLGSAVAVKETLFDDAALLKAFEREARLLASLRHTALPKVIDHFPEGEGHFLVMEFIAGDDLGEMLKQHGGAFPVGQVLDWGDQLLGALAYLHKQTPPVIHRDIKPQNLKLTDEGQIVLLDFGLAKGHVEGMSRVTAGRSILGYTPNYAPLEQIQGAGTDERSDLYSLAATLFHLMTGFTPVDAFSRAAAIVTGQPDPLRSANTLNPQVPPLVADVLMRAMSQNRDHRPASAAAMRRVLQDAAGNLLPTVIASSAQGTAPPSPAASQTPTESEPETLIRPSPIVVPLPAPREQTAYPVARAADENRQLERATAAHSARTMEAASLLTPQQSYRPLRIILGLGVLLIVGAFIIIVINSKPTHTTDSAAETLDATTKLPSGAPASGATDTTAKPPAKAADPVMKSYDFVWVTMDANGNITDRRKGQARYYSEDLGNDVSLDLVEIAGGTFLMGSPDNEAGRYNDEWPHQVTVSPFCLGKYEVTQAQWRAVAKLPKVKIDLSSDPSKFKGDALPVEEVSWEDAAEFCARLSKAAGRTYRLPTEAEWEYACRAGTTTPFAFGETIAWDLMNYNGNFPYAGESKGLFREKTTPVGSLGCANGFGLFDMLGNVWEWCQDWYSENYYNQSPIVNPTGPSAGSYRVMRGGSWLTGARGLRSANRSKVVPTERIFETGFRIARPQP
jgi:formylglycine-generating enzyme required for sulfatase activity/serine/threonine protein kinase